MLNEDPFHPASQHIAHIHPFHYHDDDQDGTVITIANASFGEKYNYCVNDTTDVRFRFLPFVLTEDVAVRISVSAANASKDFPVLFVIKQQKSVMSWQIPLIVLKSFSYQNVSRTLCPLREEYNKSEELIIDVSTMSLKSVNFTLEANFDYILLKTEINSTQVSPAKPRYFLYEFPEDIDSVVVIAESDDRICSVMSVQDTTCPVYDLLDSIEFIGFRQSVTKRGAITIQKSKFKSGSFFVVLVVKPNDYDCSLIDTIQPYPPSTPYEGKVVWDRVKTYNISVEPAISKSEFLGATLGALFLFVFIYVVAFTVGVIYHYRNRNNSLVTEIGGENLTETRGLLESDNHVRNYSSFPTGHGSNPGPSNAHDDGTGGEECERGDMPPRRRSGGSSSSSEVSLDDEAVNDVDFLQDANQHRDVVRTKASVCVADLSRKPEKVLNKKYNLYIWNLVTLAIFYGLPVIQLVITYQTVVNKTGDEDLCYYNFYCARSLGVLTSFNNVYSNIGYVLLGILFIILVLRRDRLYYLHQQQNQRTQACGIPQHFGVFYAMGIALAMEGILSACYHVCPSYNNFQFDTAFMYMIGWLTMLKIYQTRHPDINAHAHTAYCAIAVVVFIGVIGVVSVYWLNCMN